MIHFDTSFVIDLLREQHRGEHGRAHQFLDALPGEGQAGISVHAVCELEVGIAHAKSPSSEGLRVKQLLSTVSIEAPDTQVFPQTYARLLTSLSRARTPIATAAVCASASLVSGNPKHFHPIPGLQVHTY